jgi:diguanylate cyclase (GGDEF)-like protein
MDVVTLLICAALVSGIMALFMSALFATSKEESFLLDWVLAGLFFFISSFLGLYGTIFDLPALIFPSLNNAFYVCAHALLCTGAGKLTKNESNFRMIAMLFVLILLIQHLPALKESIQVRILVFYPIITCFNLLVIKKLWNGRHLYYSKSFILLGVTVGLFIFQNIIRGLAYLLPEFELPLVSTEVLKFSGSLSLIAFIFLITLSMTVIVTWKKELTLKKITMTDSLTSWSNRRALDIHASKEYERAKRNKCRFGFVLLDIDHFKQINDKFGHKVGDHALVEFCRTVEQVNREYDYEFRLGGEEFAVLVSDTQEQAIMQIAERIRALVKSQKIETENGTLSMTVSIGVAISSDADFSWESVLNRADKALYQAKQTGRDKSVYLAG